MHLPPKLYQSIDPQVMIPINTSNNNYSPVIAARSFGNKSYQAIYYERARSKLYLKNRSSLIIFKRPLKHRHLGWRIGTQLLLTSEHYEKLFLYFHSNSADDKKKKKWATYLLLPNVYYFLKSRPNGMYLLILIKIRNCCVIWKICFFFTDVQNIGIYYREQIFCTFNIHRWVCMRYKNYLKKTKDDLEKTYQHNW